MKQVVETLEDPENPENCEELGVEDLDKVMKSGLGRLAKFLLQTVL